MKSLKQLEKDARNEFPNVNDYFIDAIVKSRHRIATQEDRPELIKDDFEERDKMSFRVVKISKNLLKKHPIDLLKKLNVADDENANPDRLFVSNQDYKEIEKNLRKIFKKEAPGATKRYLDKCVGFELLNYGPNTTLGSAIKPGYGLILKKTSGNGDIFE